MAFCSLIQAFRPDLIDYSSVRKSDDRATQIKNLNLAFDTAANSLGIPRMLDATDMTQARPDEKSVMTCVLPRSASSEHASPALLAFRTAF